MNISFTLLNLYVATWLSFPCKACSALLPCLWLDCIESTFVLVIPVSSILGWVGRLLMTKVDEDVDIDKKANSQREVNDLHH